jgi:polar amino acid transport system permease protein
VTDLTAERNAVRTGPEEGPRVVARRRPGAWVASIVVVILVGFACLGVASDPRFAWGVIGHYFTSTQVLSGLLLTIILTVVTMALGITLGTILALMRLSRTPVLKVVSFAYVYAFRGTPVLVQIIIWYNLASLYPHITLAIPFVHAFASAATNDIISPLTAAILGLGLNQAAYTAEVVRAGIASVDEGQTDAARAIGMSRGTTLRRIVIPQAMRVIIPPIGNETIGMLKMTSLASVISLNELLQSVTNIYALNYQTIPLLMVASIWYLIVTSVLTIGQHFIERHYSRGTSRSAGIRTHSVTGWWGRMAYWARTS